MVRALTARELSVFTQTACLTHREAAGLFERALRAASSAATVVIDLSRVSDATTSAFARLVLLRRELRRRGADLCLRGLRGRAALLYQLNRLNEVLPCTEARQADDRSGSAADGGAAYGTTPSCN